MIYLYNKSTLQQEKLTNWNKVSEWEQGFENSSKVKLDWFPSDVEIINPIYKDGIIREATREEQIEELEMPIMDGEYIDAEGYHIIERLKGEYWKWETNTWVEDTEKKNQTRIIEIKDRLKEIDLESVRPLRAINNQTSTQYDIDKLLSLDIEAQGLRDELDTKQIIP